MGEFDSEEEEIKKLVERYNLMLEEGNFTFFDEDDMELIISEFMLDQDFPKAEEAIERAISMFPFDSYFRILLVRLLILKLDFEKAQQELDSIEQYFPPTIEFYTQKVLLARMTGEDINAVALLKKALDIDPDDADVNFLLSYEYLKKKNLPKAIHYAVFALQADESYDEQLYGFSYLLETNQQYEDGVTFYEELTKKFPMRQGCWFGLGLAYSWLKQYDKAIDAYQYVLSIYEDTPPAHFNIANCYFESKNYDSAMEHYKFVSQADPDDYTSLTCIGDCYAIQDKDDEAITYYRKALKINPICSDAILGIATLLHDQGRNDEAQAFLEQAFRQTPQSFELLFNILPYYDEAQQIEKLKEFFEITLEQVENKSDFFHFFIAYCCEKEMYEYGIEVLESQKDLPELFDKIAYYLAALYFLNNQVPQATEYLSNALTIDYEGYKDFLSIDPILETYSQVHELIELYKS